MDNLGYTVIQDWMYGLGLRLPETVCLAVIFGFSQDESSAFCGSRQYMAAKMCVKDVKTVDSALKSLIFHGYITRTVVVRNNMKFPEYRVTEKCLRMGMEKTDRGAKISDTSMEIMYRTNKETRTKRFNRESQEKNLIKL